tara:strand:+ start:347 stop:634 length:288 start_codon:yes stop_codon:yes gene_type:complete
MKDWETWGFEPIGTYSRPPKNQREIELCYAIFFGSTMPEAKEILISPAGERILQEAKNNGWSTHTIAKEMQNYIDYKEEKDKETIVTNGSGNPIP